MIKVRVAQMQAAVRTHRALLSGIFVGGFLVIAALLAMGRSNKPAKATPPPLEVEVVKVAQTNVPIYSEWIGTTDGMVNAQIKSQVTGY